MYYMVKYKYIYIYKCINIILCINQLYSPQTAEIKLRGLLYFAIMYLKLDFRYTRKESAVKNKCIYKTKDGKLLKNRTLIGGDVEPEITCIIR